jgi:hypothetical protein
MLEKRGACFIAPPFRSLIFDLAGAGAEAGVKRRQAEAAEHQQAWQPLSAQAVCERSTRRAAVQGQAVAGT